MEMKYFLAFKGSVSRLRCFGPIVACTVDLRGNVCLLGRPHAKKTAVAFLALKGCFCHRSISLARALEHRRQQAFRNQVFLGSTYVYIYTHVYLIYTYIYIYICMYMNKYADKH